MHSWVPDRMDVEGHYSDSLVKFDDLNASFYSSKKGNTFLENLWCQGKMDVMGFHTRSNGPYKGYDKLTNRYMSTNFSEVQGCIGSKTNKTFSLYLYLR